MVKKYRHCLGWQYPLLGVSSADNTPCKGYCYASIGVTPCPICVVAKLTEGADMDPFSLVIKMTMMSISIVGFFLKIIVQLVVSIAGTKAHSAPVMPQAPQHVDQPAEAEAAFQAAEYERQRRAYYQRMGG